MQYHIITFGCQMNKADSERIAADMEKKGYKKASKINEADLIVVNMCSVRQSAVDRVYGLISKFKKLKAKTILTGCILKEDEKKFKKALVEEDKSSSPPFAAVRVFDEIKKMRQLNCPSALIPISYGCNNFCTYCVVPYTRGKLTCRPHQEIIKEAKEAIRSSLKEIWLLGQNVNDYHSPADRTVNFAKLLRMVNNIPGKFSVRFMSPHPKNFTVELIRAMAESPKIAKYLNLPLQSGNDNILRKMNRPYTVKQYKDLVKKIRQKIPDINLTTDVIVGFPGETKKQFENTVKLFKEIKFNIAYISKYSPRPGTAAFQMKDDVPLTEKKHREKVLKKLLKNSR